MLSRFMLVTDRRLMKPSFEKALRAALEGGARLVQLREKDLGAPELQLLADAAQRMCEKFGATLLINSELEIALKVGASGVHWPERDFEIEYSKAHINGVSVHSVESARQAQKLGANYLVFGSIFPTSSHPNQTAKGVEALREVVRAVPIPVFAIGGISDEAAVKLCLEAGAHGVAVRSAIWQSDDVAKSVAQLRRWIGD